MMTKEDNEFKEQLSLANDLIQAVLGKATVFKSTRILFKEYWENLQKKESKKVTQKVHHYTGEVFAKFWQLDFLLEKIKELESRIESKRQESILNGNTIQKSIQKNKAAQNITKGGIKKIADLNAMVDSLNDTSMYKIELYTECFYYVAHRLKKIIDYYPGLRDFRPSGIINVRNNLIEHPHGKDGVTFPSFGLGSPNGPVVKAARTEGEKNKSVDQGLYKNAFEFRDLLEQVLNKGLQSFEN